MRIVGLVIGTIILIFVVAVVIFAATFDVNKYRGTIQSDLQKQLGRPVKLGDMHLSLLPPRFRVETLAIADDPRFNAETPFVKAQQLSVAVKILPLLHGQIAIASLALERPSVDLIKNRQGMWNFQSLGQGKESAAGASQATRLPGQQAPSERNPEPEKNASGERSAAPSRASQEKLRLDKLTIRDGQVSFTDQQASKLPTVYDHIDVTLSNFSPDQPFSIEARAHLAGTGAEQVRLQGEGGPVVQNNPATTPFRGTLDLKQVGLADMAKFLNSAALAGTDGVLTGQTQITSQSGKVSAHGETTAQNVKVHGTDLGFSVVANYEVSDDLVRDLLTLNNVTVKLGPTPLLISGTINSQPTPAQLDVKLRAANVSLSEMAKLASLAGMALEPGTNVSGNVDADIQVRGPATKPALNGSLSARNLEASGKQIPQPVKIQSVNLKLTPAEIQSSPFNVVSGGTTLNTQFGLRNYLSPAPALDAIVRAPTAQLPAILSMAKAYGIHGLDSVNGQGVLGVDLHAAGPLKSVTSEEIMKALNGAINVNFNNVQYAGADIGHELASIAGFLNAPSKAQGLTNILKMTGNILVRNGVAQTNNLQAVLDMGTIGVAGTANLVDQALNMRLTSVLSPQFSQKVGGNSIGGFMRTALANNQGELVIPALVTGTFSKPRFAPDLQQVAQMKLKGLVPNLNNPASIANSLQNLLGGVKNPAQTPPSQTNPQPTQQNPVQQILGILGKKNQQKPQPPPK